MSRSACSWVAIALVIVVSFKPPKDNPTPRPTGDPGGQGSGASRLER